MKLLIDIGHPAHVHYFKNLIKIMQNKGNQIFVIARDKEVTQYLLNKYGIKYLSRGKGGKGFIGKLIYLFKCNFILLKISIKIKPDLFLSFSSAYIAQVSWILRKPHIVLDDTEHAKFEHLMYKPFSKVIITPDCFQKKLGKKQIKFPGYMELSYLHPNRFSADHNILEELKIRTNEKYVVLRLVSWEASHDWGKKGVSNKFIYKFIKEISRYAKIFISSEKGLPEDLIDFRLPVSPDKFHDVLAYASLYVGEGATTASECVILGVPAIYINRLSAGTLKDQEKYGLFSVDDEEKLIDLAKKILTNPHIKEIYKNYRHKLIENKIDVTSFLVWFIEHYPFSVEEVKKVNFLEKFGIKQWK